MNLKNQNEELYEAELENFYNSLDRMIEIEIKKIREAAGQVERMRREQGFI